MMISTGDQYVARISIGQQIPAFSISRHHAEQPLLDKGQKSILLRFVETVHFVHK